MQILVWVETTELASHFLTLLLSQKFHLCHHEMWNLENATRMSLALTHATPPSLREVSLLDLLGNYHLITLYFGQVLGIEFGIHNKCTLRAGGRWLYYSILEDESHSRDWSPEWEVFCLCNQQMSPQKTERWGSMKDRGLSTDEYWWNWGQPNPPREGLQNDNTQDSTLEWVLGAHHGKKRRHTRNQMPFQNNSWRFTQDSKSLSIV